MGARRLAAMGFSEYTIMLLARWASAVIQRYIREAPLLALTAEYRARRQGQCVSAPLEAALPARVPVPRAIPEEMARTYLMVESLACAHRGQEECLAKLAGELALAVSLPAFVVNSCTG
eukprot:7985836-Heterocapsa_arctica.AAC.1